VSVRSKWESSPSGFSRPERTKAKVSYRILFNAAVCTDSALRLSVSPCNAAMLLDLDLDWPPQCPSSLAFLALLPATTYQIVISPNCESINPPKNSLRAATCSPYLTSEDYTNCGGGWASFSFDSIRNRCAIGAVRLE
jgi:hypothetical protein